MEAEVSNSAVSFWNPCPFITGEILHIDGGQAAGHSEPFG
jgi:hypothetical protein